MEDHLSSLDAAFWGMESREAPLRLGALAVFGAGARTRTAEELAALLAQRASALPRLRQVVRQGWNPLEAPRWHEVPWFDARAHVEVRHLPAAARGLEAAALEREAARAACGALPEGAPPWRLHLFTGRRPEEGFALLAEFHHASVDGLRAMELGAALFDPMEVRGRTFGGPPEEGREGGGGEPVGGVLRYADPRRAVDAVRAIAGLPGRIPGQVARTRRAAEIAASVAATAAGNALHPQASPLHAAVGPAACGRAFAFPVLPLDAVHRIRKAHGGTVNDVLLALCAAALRHRIQAAGHDPAARPVRVLVPVSSRRRPGDPRLGNQLSGHLLRLPLGESDPLERLRLVREAMRAHKERGPRRGPGAFALLTDLVPPAAHRLAGPLLRESAPLLFDALATSVPLPDIPFTLDGAPLRALHPLAPLAGGHQLAVAMTPYRGAVHFGLHGSADGALPPAALAGALHGALRELCALS
ncbi:wax ester/triacylglycerol synthase domain-containing protein [Streptomyces sp. ODS28]|uniref:wax ester/triacylglycerol synthase domain-containing protein n=1 Tax=Streptomyces sp. ODS28 TaxID=3136688 RepID=UPI0031F1900C